MELCKIRNIWKLFPFWSCIILSTCETLYKKVFLLLLSRHTVIDIACGQNEDLVLDCVNSIGNGQISCRDMEMAKVGESMSENDDRMIDNSQLTGRNKVLWNTVGGVGESVYSASFCIQTSILMKRTFICIWREKVENVD